MKRAMLGMVMVLAMAGAAAGQVTVTPKAVWAWPYEAMIEPTGGFTKKEVALYSKVVKAPDGKTLVRLQMFFDVKWGEKRDQATLTPENVIITADGAPADVIGTGIMPGLIEVKKPQDPVGPPLGKTDHDPNFLAFWVVAVPKGAKKVTVKVGDKAVTDAITTEVLKAGGEGMGLTIKVTGARLLDSVPVKDSSDVLKNDGGKLLVVNFTYAPKANVLYTFRSDFLNARIGKTAVGCEGCLVKGALERYYGATMPPPFPPVEAVFKVPADTTAFDLTWLGQAIAKGTVGK